MQYAYKWVLLCEATVKRGVAKASASPGLLIAPHDPGKDPAQGRPAAEFEAVPCKSLIDWAQGGPAPIVRGQPLEDDLPARVGIVGARYRDGTRLEGRVNLTPDEILHLYTQKLPGPWEMLWTGSGDWIESGDVQEVLAAHLAFLRRWGLGGGIAIKSMTAAQRLVVPFLRDWISDAPDMRMLVVADKALAPDLADALSTAFLYLGRARDPAFTPPESGGAVVVSQQAIVLHEGIRSAKWDVIFFLGLDDLYASTASKAFQCAAAMRGGQRVAVVTKPMHYLNRRTERAVSKLLRMTRSRDWPMLVRDGRRCPRAIFSVDSGLKQRISHYALRTMEDSSLSYMRRRAIPAGDLQYYYASVSAIERFLQKKRPAVIPPEAYLPFPEGFPNVPHIEGILATFAAISRRIQRGEAFEAEDGYLVLYAMDRIHAALRKKTERGRDVYDALIDIAARVANPLAAQQVLLWAMDFAYQFLEPELAWETYERMIPFLTDPPWLNAYLTAKGSAARLTDFTPMQWSRMIDVADRSEADWAAIGRAFAAVEAACQREHGCGLFGLFRPDEKIAMIAHPYEHCGLSRAQEIRLELYPFTAHLPLREFLTDAAILALRLTDTMRKYNPKTVKTTLEPVYLSAVEEAFGLAPRVQAQLPRKVSIDVARVAQLERESESVRLALTLDAGNADPAENPYSFGRMSVPDGEGSGGSDEPYDFAIVPARAVSADAVSDVPGNAAAFEEKARAGARKREDSATGAVAPSSAPDVPSVSPEIARIFQRLNPAARCALTALKARGAQGYQEAARAQGAPPALLFDEINEAAMEVLSDLLLVEDDAGVSIAEEYIDLFEDPKGE